MAYEKQTWATGDTITAAKLNHMEDGIAEGNPFFIINLTYDEETSEALVDKTNAEIWAAWQAGKIPMLVEREAAYEDSTGEALIADRPNSVLFVSDTIAVFSWCYVWPHNSQQYGDISAIEIKTDNNVQTILFPQWAVSP